MGTKLGAFCLADMMATYVANSIRMDTPRMHSMEFPCTNAFICTHLDVIDIVGPHARPVVPQVQRHKPEQLFAFASLQGS